MTAFSKYRIKSLENDIPLKLDSIVKILQYDSFFIIVLTNGSFVLLNKSSYDIYDESYTFKTPKNSSIIDAAVCDHFLVASLELFHFFKFLRKNGTTFINGKIEIFLKLHKFFTIDEL